MMPMPVEYFMHPIYDLLSPINFPTDAQISSKKHTLQNVLKSYCQYLQQKGNVEQCKSQIDKEACRLVENSERDSLSCNSDEIVVLGGGTCHAYQHEKHKDARIFASHLQPGDLSVWSVQCVDHHDSNKYSNPAKISAICCKKSLFLEMKYTQSFIADSLSCEPGKYITSGGASCHTEDQSYLTITSTSIDQYFASCFVNPHNFKRASSVSAICLSPPRGYNCTHSHAKFSDHVQCDPSAFLLSVGVRCHFEIDESITWAYPTSVRDYKAWCVNHDDWDRNAPPITIDYVCCKPQQD